MKALKVEKVNRSHKDNLKTQYYQSPVGWIEVQSTEGGLRAVNFVDEKTLDEENNIHNDLTINQLDEYFNRKRQKFDIPLDIEGTEFQKRVWHELSNIPFGKTKSYMDIAKALGDVKAIRAVGLANGSNKIAIIIPCHRIIGSDGSLVGYAAGIQRKKWLLDFEIPPIQASLF
jgi:methylated-DNA-[protein]-cysteine S-methyltransferase